MGDTVRDRMFFLANEAIGLGYGRANKEQYLDLVAPGEDARTRESLGRASSCGLVVRGLWGRLGLDDPRLRAPYKIGSVIANIVYMAREADAWIDASELAKHTVEVRAEWAAARRARAREEPSAAWAAGWLEQGDVLVIDVASPKAHVCTVVGVLPNSAAGPEAETTSATTEDGSSLPPAIFSVDGGQRDGAGAELVLRRRRLLSVTPDRRVMLSPGDSYGLGTRELSGVVDLEQLARRFLPATTEAS